MSANQTYNEQELLLRIAEGDEQAFRIFYDTYRKKIYSFAVYFTRSDVLAKDIVQEIFLKVWSNRKELHRIEQLNAWMKTIARNTALNHFKRMANERRLLTQLVELQGEPIAENKLELKQYMHLLHEAIAQLPPQQKKVYLLSKQQGHKNKEIADELGISIYTVKEYLKGAMQSIRKQLEGHIELCLIASFSMGLMST